MSFSPANFRHKSTRLVSYYALFKWLLLLSQHPSCLSTFTSFITQLILGTLTNDLGCFPLDYGAYPPQSDSYVKCSSIRSLIVFGSLVGPKTQSVTLPPLHGYIRLALKLFRGEPAISEFDQTFTPPLSSSHHFSTQTRSDLHSVLPELHPDQGQITRFRVCYLLHLFAQLALAFAMASPFKGLTCNKQQLAGSLCKRHAVTRAKRINSINIVLPPLVSTWFQVLFHSPKRGSFHLSLTLLVHYRSPKVFSLRRWSSLIHTGFHVTGITRDITKKNLYFFHLRDYHPLQLSFPAYSIKNTCFLEQSLYCSLQLPRP